MAAAATTAIALPALAQDDQGGGRGRLRQACGADFQQYCSDVPAGGGARIKCLQDHNDRLSDGCKTALSEIQAKRAGQGGAGSKTAAPEADDQK
jgi:hypothetical protein